MTVPDPHCTDCMPWDGGAMVDCLLLDDFSNRDTLGLNTGWGDASYIYASGDHLKWDASDPTNAWVQQSFRAALALPAASGATISVTTHAPTAYGSFMNTTAGSGYWYQVSFDIDGGFFVSTAGFRLRDANGEVFIKAGANQVTATRFGAVQGTYTSGTVTFAADVHYVVWMYVDPTVTRVIVNDPTGTILSASTSVATTPVVSTGVDLEVALVGTGGAEPGYWVYFTEFRAGPCERPLGQATPWSKFKALRVRQATAMGASPSTISGPTFSAGGTFWAYWDSRVTGSDQGNQEEERRYWESVLVPPGTQYVRLLGTVAAYSAEAYFSAPSPALAVTAYWQMGTIAFNPDTGPASFDALGSDMSGSVYFATDATDQNHPVDLSASGIGASYNAGDGIAWHLFQLSLANTSLRGIGSHTYAAKPGHADGGFLEVLDRFSGNPDWQRAPSSPVSYSEPISDLVFTVKYWAFGTNGGTGTVVPPRINQPVQDEFIATGDGVTQAFTTRFPYANLSLEIDVDGMKVGVEETGASTGAFTLSFAPAVGEQIYATYRARG